MSRQTVTSLNLPENTIINENGLWQQQLNARARFINRAALFLDRDGVIVVEAHYLHRIEDCILIPGAAEVISLANKGNIPVIMVTNQGGIGQEIFDWPEFMQVQDKIMQDLAAQSAHIDAVFACPHHPKGTFPYDKGDAADRKPNSGMIKAAEKILSINLAKSIIIGDRANDLRAGKNAGLYKGILVRTGHGHPAEEQQKARKLEGPDFKVTITDSLADCTSEIPVF